MPATLAPSQTDLQRPATRRRGPLRRLRDRFRAHPMWGDVLLMLLVAPLTLFGTAGEMADLGRLPRGVGLLFGLAFTLPLAWRRTRPELAAAVVALAHVVQVPVFDTIALGNITAPMMLYAAVRYGHPKVARWLLAVAVLGSAAGALRWGWYTSPLAHSSVFWQRVTKSIAYFLADVSVVLAAWFMGQWARQRQMTLDSLRQRAQAVEREHAKAVELAAEEERSRIAREMHDIVAHSLSVIVVQSDGAAYLAGHDELGDPEARLAQVTKALETIGQTARGALGETRRLVGVLRHDGESAELAPAAGLEQLEQLVHGLEGSGIPASYRRTGDPAAHAAFPASAQMALYRVAQESLTNAIKHAGPGAHVTVELHEDEHGAELVVRDTGVGATPTDGAGHGLVGMRERMTAWGGTLVAGPHAAGGFEVRAQLPAPDGGHR